jgi:hypothetical protein
VVSGVTPTAGRRSATRSRGWTSAARSRLRP